jgi:hypothetical protein
VVKQRKISLTNKYLSLSTITSMNEQARIALTVNGNTFEICGPEDFVSAQAEFFRDAIIETLARSTSGTDEEPSPETETPPAAPHHEPTGKVTYTRVFHIEADKVRILKAVPGSTLSKKAVGTALIYLWAKREAGIDAVPFAELRDLCKDQGCLDTNFASHMKGARSWIIIDGAKGSSSQTCKITIPGVEKAVELLEQLNGK